MAVTLYRKRKTINRITIINGTDMEDVAEIVEQPDTSRSAQTRINEKIRGKMYGRRTVNRQN